MFLRLLNKAKVVFKTLQKIPLDIPLFNLDYLKQIRKHNIIKIILIPYSTKYIMQKF